MLGRTLRTVMAVCGMAALALPALCQRQYMTVDYPGYGSSVPLGINNRGDIVGYYTDYTGVTHGYVRINGGFSLVDVPGAIATGCGAITDNLDIAGTYFDTQGFQHGFVMHKGVFTSIDVPGAGHTNIPYENGPGLGTSVYGMNSGLDLVGQYADTDGVAHAFRYRKGTFDTIDNPNVLPFPGLGTNIFGINEAGTMVGAYRSPGPPISHGFLLKNQQFTPIDVPFAGGFFGTQSNGLNNRGDVVGLYSDLYNFGHGFLLHEGIYTSIDYPGAFFTECHCINDQGTITGLYYDMTGTQHGFISTR